jgi:SnoaL-like domain
MNREAVQDWLARYTIAWKRYDADAIGDLFAEHATYRYHPYDEGEAVVRGREEIVRSWVAPEGSESGRDEPGTFEAHYEPFAVDGDRAVATGTTTYFTDASQQQVERVFHNVFLLRFDGEGRCTEFIETFIQAPAGS